MEARDSTSLKDNVSKCQLLGVSIFPPESAMRAICVGLSGREGPGGFGRAWPSLPCAPPCLDPILGACASSAVLAC